MQKNLNLTYNLLSNIWLICHIQQNYYKVVSEDRHFRLFSLHAKKWHIRRRHFHLSGSWQSIVPLPSLVRIYNIFYKTLSSSLTPIFTNTLSALIRFFFILSLGTFAAPPPVIRDSIITTRSYLQFSSIYLTSQIYK